MHALRLALHDHASPPPLPPLWGQRLLQVLKLPDAHPQVGAHQTGDIGRDVFVHSLSTITRAPLILNSLNADSTSHVVGTGTNMLALLRGCVHRTRCHAHCHARAVSGHGNQRRREHAKQWRLVELNTTQRKPFTERRRGAASERGAPVRQHAYANSS